jgi:very-short-patch-repair endonuclease
MFFPRPLMGEGGAQRREREMTLLDNARSLRTHQTDAEQKLWQQLRANRFMGLKFKRQKPMGPYIADFVCLECRLIVEVDGSQHLLSLSDQARDAWFVGQGYRVLRFWNNQVLQEMDGVLESIRQVVISPPPQAVKGGA